MRVLALLALAAFILLPLVQAVILSFTATLPTDRVADGTLGLMNWPRPNCGRRWSTR